MVVIFFLVLGYICIYGFVWMIVNLFFIVLICWIYDSFNIWLDDEFLVCFLGEKDYLSRGLMSFF